MSKRGVVTDIGGEELYADDIIVYATRQANRVRLTEAKIIDVTAVLVKGRLLPMLKVKPTGVESGFTKRRSMRSLWITTEHVRLVRPAADAV